MWHEHGPDGLVWCGMSERVLVCGDRNWRDRLFLCEVLDTFHRLLHFECVIEGEAKGADSMARQWAERARVPVLSFPADWQTHGKAAGPIRNGRMLAEGMPTLVLAFHDDIEASKGTKDMVARARRANVPTFVLTRRANARLRATQTTGAGK